MNWWLNFMFRALLLFVYVFFFFFFFLQYNFNKNNLRLYTKIVIIPDLKANCKMFPYNIWDGCGIPSRDPHSSWHFILSFVWLPPFLLVENDKSSAIEQQQTSGDLKYKAQEKYRGIFELQKSGDKTSSGEIGLDIRTHASPKVGQDQVSGGVSVLCGHAAPVAYVLWKPCTNRWKVKFGNKVQISNGQKLV